MFGWKERKILMDLVELGKGSGYCLHMSIKKSKPPNYPFEIVLQRFIEFPCSKQLRKWSILNGKSWSNKSKTRSEICCIVFIPTCGSRNLTYINISQFFVNFRSSM